MNAVVLVVSATFHRELARRQTAWEVGSPKSAPATILGMQFRVSEYMPRDCFGLETAAGIKIFRMEHVRSTVQERAVIVDRNRDMI